MTVQLPLASPQRFVSVAEAFRARAHESHIERVSWGAPQDLPGVIADAFGSLLVVTLYAPGSTDVADEWGAALEKVWHGKPWILKTRGTSATDGYAIRMGVTPAPTPLIAQESGVHFEIGTDPRHDFGVFPDAAVARQAVRAEARGRNVLNLFSYTCGFALAALAGGASSACNVDPSRDYLTWGKRNAAVNGFDFRVIPDTAQAFLRRQARRLEKGGAPEFDFVVADPPAFGVGRDADRLLRTFWPEMADLIGAMAPARIVLLFNDRHFREWNDVGAFVQKKFGSAYDAQWLEALPKESPADPFYLPPQTVVLRRRT